jgi:hypothetical protein
MKKFILLLLVPIQMFAVQDDDNNLSDFLNFELQQQIDDAAERFDHKKLLLINDENFQFYLKGQLDAYYYCLILINHVYNHQEVK